MKLAYEELEKKYDLGSLSECMRSLSLSKGSKGRQSITLTGITDGTFIPDVPFECRAEPKADSKYPCVMAASILAKTCRDRIMMEYDKKYPEYGYARHKGYPTPEHKKICRQIGPSPIQRLSFKY